MSEQTSPGDTTGLHPAEAEPAVYRVLVATELDAQSLALLVEADDLEVTIFIPNGGDLAPHLRAAHALIIRNEVEISAELLESAPNLKIIARVGTDITGIDIDRATARGISVMNAPGTNATAVAEYTIALMLALSRKLIAAHNSLKNGGHQPQRSLQAGSQLKGKTLGIVGLGRVGRAVAQRCLAFGMTVLAFDPYLSADQIGSDRIRLVNLPELLQNSDFISIHAATTRQTHGLFDENTIRQMKPGARLINVAHGSLIDEQALAGAIRDGHLAGAAVDVFAQEAPFQSALIGLENVVHTPHIADNTAEATQDLSLQIVQQVMDALRGSDYRNVVNMPFAPGLDFEQIRPYLILAECIGRLQRALADEPVQRVAVEYRGEAVSGLVKPLTVALLKGLLAPVLGDKVNYINAPILAHERGLQITQTKGLQTGNYTSLVSCQVTWDGGGERVIAGTLFDGKESRIVQIDRYRSDFVPQGDLLIMGSYDRPGVIGRVGTLLAEHEINIASWRTGRIAPGGHTLTVISLDHLLPQAVLDNLRQQDFVRHAIQVRI